MKRILLSIIATLIIGVMYSQVVSESTIRKFNIGVGMSTDIWLDLPSGMDARTINQGAQVFGMYNHRIKESKVHLAGGIGVTTHNLYSDNIIEDIKADSISFVKIPDNISYKKSKVCLAYIDVPLEFRIKSEKGFRVAFGFKFGYMINSHIKYKGNRLYEDGEGSYETDQVDVKVKSKDISETETWRYGPTFRIGYKWANLTVYYQLSKVFKVSKGPEFYPLSIGFAVIPF